MVQFKTKIKNGEIRVKSKYDGNLNDFQIDMVGIIAEFGTHLVRMGMEKELIEAVLDNILRVAKESIHYKEGE